MCHAVLSRGWKVYTRCILWPLSAGIFSMESLIKPSVPPSPAVSSCSLLVNSLRAAGSSTVMAPRFPGPPTFSSHNPFLLPYLRRYEHMLSACTVPHTLSSKTINKMSSSQNVIPKCVGWFREISFLGRFPVQERNCRSFAGTVERVYWTEPKATCRP